MKISVVIAAYRGEKYIAEQLQSIAEQTRLPDEVIICDDSPDTLTKMEVEKFTAVLPLKYHANIQRLGITANFNRALSLASGDVVFLCDQDDIWYPEKTVTMSNMLDPGGMQAVFCDSDITDADNNLCGFTHLQSRGYGFLRDLPPGEWQNQLADCCRRVPAAGHDMAFTRPLLQKLLPLPALPECHDTYLGTAAAALGAWRLCPQSLGTFRRHGSSASQAGRKMSLTAQLRAAKESVKNNTFAWNAALFQEILDRQPDLDDATRSLLCARIKHSANRAAMSRNILFRVPQIYRELRSGNYARFGRGWKNVIQDLFFR